MEFGLRSPFFGPMANAEDIRTIAQAGERFGYGFISVADHIVVPRVIDTPYPYTEDGEFLWSETGTTDCLEQFTLLAWLAAATTEIRLLTGIAVIPHRNPLFMAKSIATTDQLSGGRVTLGCGTGWLREEFEALNITEFDDRGRVTNEYLEAMLELWHKDSATYHGEFIAFSDVAADPKPLQRPHPPIWIGGESMPALRRTVALGDAWYPIGTNPKFPMDTIDGFVTRRDRLFAEAEQVGRDPGSIGLAYNCTFNSEVAQHGRDGGRLMLTGSPEQRVGDIDALTELGVTTMTVDVAADELNPMLERMQAFSEEVMPLVN